MRIVVALGGNALLRRGEPLTAENQRRNARIAAEALAPLAEEHELLITHGNGPQVGLLALKEAAYKPDARHPLDMLDAETEGMIGYLIEQELRNVLPGCPCATLLTQIEVDPTDPAFENPTKPIGPVYGEREGQALAAKSGWELRRDGEHYRRVVPSPRPQRILELDVLKLLVREGVMVICAGGGGIPNTRRADGRLEGVEAVIDKDLASALLAREVKADALLMLTDVDAVYSDWGGRHARAMRRISPRTLGDYEFPSGTMGPKVDAATEFVERTGGMAGIGRLSDARLILSGGAGTVIAADTAEPVWWT